MDKRIGGYYYFDERIRRLNGVYRIRNKDYAFLHGMESMVEIKKIGSRQYNVKFIDLYYSALRSDNESGYSLVGFKEGKVVWNDIIKYESLYGIEKWWAFIEALRIAKGIIKKYGDCILRLRGHYEDVIRVFNTGIAESGCEVMYDAAIMMSHGTGYYELELIKQEDNLAYTIQK